MANSTTYSGGKRHKTATMCRMCRNCGGETARSRPTTQLDRGSNAQNHPFKLTFPRDGAAMSKLKLLNTKWVGR